MLSSHARMRMRALKAARVLLLYLLKYQRYVIVLCLLLWLPQESDALNAELALQLSAANVRADELASALASAQAELVSQLQAADAMKSEYEARIAATASRADAVAADLAVSQTQTSTLQTELSEAHTQLAALRADFQNVRSLVSEESDLQSQLSQLQSQLTDTLLNARKQQDSNLQLQAQLDAAIASKNDADAVTARLETDLVASHAKEQHIASSLSELQALLKSELSQATDQLSLIQAQLATATLGGGAG